MIPFQRGDLVYFKFRAIVGCVLETQAKSSFPPNRRIDVLIIASPENAPYQKGDAVLELAANLEHFDPVRGAHLLAPR